MKHEGWTVEELTPAQLDSLHTYEALLVEHALPRGMVASSDLGHLWERHILDSLRAVPLIEEGPVDAVDLGSGAGLPGIPLAVARPDLSITLVEPRHARAAFLELTIERLGLNNGRVFPKAVAELSAASVALCLARGFRDPSETWSVARDLLLPEGELIYWGGRTFRHEQVPEGARIKAIGRPALETGGPIVIMTRQ